MLVNARGDAADVSLFVKTAKTVSSSEGVQSTKHLRFRELHGGELKASVSVVSRFEVFGKILGD
jgi:hypothetical protein